MAFYWEPLKRSVRIVGRAEKISPEETAEYYHSRPIGSQVGAWASAQSTVLENREQLEENVKEIEERFDIKDGKTQIPVPPFWGGVRSESHNYTIAVRSITDVDTFSRWIRSRVLGREGE